MNVMHKKKNVRINRLLAAMLILLVAFGSLNIMPVMNVNAARGTTYYVDSVNGSDNASGTKPVKAWKSLDKVNNTVFSPGDKILFKAGCVFVGQLYPKGSGSKGAPITISMYGEGAKPVIMADGRNNTIVTLYNQEYWEITNLDITSNNMPDVGYGINIIGQDSGTLDHIHIKNNYIHDIAGSLSTKLSGGIFLTVMGKNIKTNFNDVLIENNTVRFVDRTGITLDAYTSWCDKRLTEYEPGVWYPSTKVVIRGNFVDDIGGDGIVMKNCLNGIIEYNTAKNCNARATDANVAIWTYTSTGTIMQHNEAYNTRYTHDGEGFDVDSFSDDTLVQYNYSHDNEGGFMLICAPGDVGTGTKGYYTNNTVVRYNISQNDGNLGVMFSGNTNNSYIYNNTIYIGEGNTTEIIDTWDWGKKWSDNILFANNLIYNLGTGDYVLGGITNTTISNNLMYGNHPMTEPECQNKITEDPLLVAPGSGGNGIYTLDGYMLKEGSPALGAGMKISNSGTKDYFGNNINTEHPNIGAYGGAGLTSIFKKGVEQLAKSEIGYIYPVYVKTDTKKAAIMPDYVTVRKKDGTQEMVKISWDEQKIYEDTGSYTVYGQLANGTKVPATITVVEPEADVFEKILVTNNIPGWKTGGTQSASYIDPMSYSGRYCLTQYDRIPFKTNVSQTIENLEDGTYTFTAYVKSNGTQNKASIIVKGEEKYSFDIEKTTGYELVKIEGIKVSGGSCKIKIATDGQADSYVQVDEIKFFKDDCVGTNLVTNSGFDIFDAASSALANETKETYAIRGTAVIDGEIDEIWEEAVVLDVDTRNFTYVSGNKTVVSATAKLLWDDQYLYVLIHVKDPVVSYTNQNFAYFRDSAEIVMDERNERDGLWIPHNETCGQWRVGAKGSDDLSGSGPSYTKNASKFQGASKITDKGYMVEMKVPFTEIVPMVGAKIGFEIQVNDDNGMGSRTGIVCWNSPTGESWQYTDVLGIVTFVNDQSQIEQISKLDIDVETDAKPDADLKDYSQYRIPVIIFAIILSTMVGVNIGIIIKKSNRTKRS